MSSRAKAKDEARRARVAEMRRAELARKRRIQIISVVSVTVLVVAVIVGAVALTAGSNDDDSGGGGGGEQAQAGDIRGEKVWEDLGRTHVSGDVEYPQSPPVGGDHHQIWADCDGTVHDEELVEEEAVHSLEHGAVWVTYTDQVGDKDVQELTDRVSSTPYSMMSPYQDQTSPITLTAWGHQLGVDSASDPRVKEFFKTYVQGEQTPEVGAACTVPQ
ncbi:DUF3105 domain-containing protein [Streptomyces sp. 6N223]|uniref:DUF3105 domain-containing protein n=1 Tax=Streptomyces sp. 6N223 TaxID=3457412 RepID=UPI003FCEFE1D